jgi:phosphatidylserine decarboxylase
MKKFFLSLFLPLLSLPVFSRIWGRIVRLRHPRFLVKNIIKRYQRAYNISMDEYEGEVEDYRSLSDFFVRKLDPVKRPLVPSENNVVSPADGILTDVETIFNDQATQVKGKTYKISQLLHETIDFSRGWHVAVIYLAPSNYHRYHYPISGNINRYFHSSGRLFPVNRVGVNRVNRLFVRNERIITEMVNRQKSCYMAAIGACFVGSIKMEFISGSRRKKRNKWVPVSQEVQQLKEMGRFDMGSTIVLVIPKSMAEPLTDMIGQPVKVGQPIFKLLSTQEPDRQKSP